MIKINKINEMQEAMSWQSISCSQFKKMLYYHPQHNIYQSGGKQIKKDDKRLISYLNQKLKPIDL